MEAPQPPAPKTMTSIDGCGEEPWLHLQYSPVQYLAGTGIYCWLFLELALKLDLATVAGGHAQTSGIGPIYLFIGPGTETYEYCTVHYF
jgi:hypothetical protein